MKKVLSVLRNIFHVFLKFAKLFVDWYTKTKKNESSGELESKSEDSIHEEV